MHPTKLQISLFHFPFMGNLQPDSTYFVQVVDSGSGSRLCKDKARTKPTNNTIGRVQNAFNIPILSPSKERGIAVSPANIQPLPSINELANPRCSGKYSCAKATDTPIGTKTPAPMIARDI